MKKTILNIFLCGVMVLGITGCGNSNDKLGGDKPLNKDYSDVVFKISRRTSACVPTELVLYKDGTYELFTSYKACKPSQPCNDILKYTKSIKGQYDYDVMKIIENSMNTSEKSYTNENRPEYEIYMGNTYVEDGYDYQYVIEKNQTNEYLDKFLKNISVDLKLCANPEYND